VRRPGHRRRNDREILAKRQEAEQAEKGERNATAENERRPESRDHDPPCADTQAQLHQGRSGDGPANQGHTGRRQNQDENNAGERKMDRRQGRRRGHAAASRRTAVARDQMVRAASTNAGEGAEARAGAAPGRRGAMAAKTSRGSLNSYRCHFVPGTGRAVILAADPIMTMMMTGNRRRRN
jgi:hypothetical protein